MPQKEFKTIVGYYTRVWWYSLRASLKKSRAYKSEIVIRLFRTLFILGTQVLLISLIYGDQNMYVGWTKSQAYLVIGIWNLLNYTGWGLFGINLERLESKVLSGEFDYYLLKPIASEWFTSFCEFSVYNWLSSISGLVLVGYYFYMNMASLTTLNILLGIGGIVIGMVFWYSFYLFFASFSLSDPRNGYMAIAKELLALTRFPTDIFSSSIQFIFYTIIPIAFIGTVPANILIGRGNILLLVAGGALSILCLLIAQWVWKWNVRKYTSAGG